VGIEIVSNSDYILCGIEAMHRVKKNQPHQRAKSAQNEVGFIHKLFLNQNLLKYQQTLTILTSIRLHSKCLHYSLSLL
jgi:hypothetical protein